MATKHILLAEADESLAHIMALLLKQAEFMVSTVKNCNEALRALATWNTGDNPVDLLITSLHQLPQQDEQLLLARLAAGRIEIPVIIITGHDDAGLLHDLKAKGCAACITKPFAAETLMNSIQAVLQ